MRLVASSMITGTAAFVNAGRLAVSDDAKADRMVPPISKSFGASAVSFSARVEMPYQIFALPSSLSVPEKTPASPSVMVESEGRNSAIMLFFRPVIVLLSVVMLSVKSADALTALSLMTMPYSLAFFMRLSVSAAVILKSGVSSCPDLPKSLLARAALFVPSSMF